MHKFMDNFELQLNATHKQDAEHFDFERHNELSQKYLSLLTEFKRVLPPGQEMVYNLIRRVEEGLRRQVHGQYQKITTVIQQNDKLKMYSHENFEQLYREFEEYKHNNSIDTYFEKQLSNETKRKVLADIKELLDSANDRALEINQKDFQKL